MHRMSCRFVGLNDSFCNVVCTPQQRLSMRFSELPNPKNCPFVGMRIPLNARFLGPYPSQPPNGISISVDRGMCVGPTQRQTDRLYAMSDICSMGCGPVMLRCLRFRPGKTGPLAPSLVSSTTKNSSVIVQIAAFLVILWCVWLRQQNTSRFICSQKIDRSDSRGTGALFVIHGVYFGVSWSAAKMRSPKNTFAIDIGQNKAQSQIK